MNSNYPDGSKNHPQPNTCHSGFERASSPGKISTNINKVPHRATTSPTSSMEMWLPQTRTLHRIAEGDITVCVRVGGQ